MCSVCILCGDGLCILYINTGSLEFCCFFNKMFHIKKLDYLSKSVIYLYCHCYYSK